MAGRTLYLSSTATASPFPTTSRKLVDSAPGSEVQLGPGEFDSGLPGTSDAGQWNPNSAIGDTTAAAEIDNTGASLGTGRQGWLYDIDLTGRTLKAGSWSVQLRLRANQGTGTAARILIRVTIVKGNAGAWQTIANLLTLQVTGAASTTAGQAGWRNSSARATVTSTAANFTFTVGDAGTSAEHTFAADERLLVEFGFCDADSTTDRTWRLDYNTANSFITTPDIVIEVAPAGDTVDVTDKAAPTAERSPADTIATSDGVTGVLAGGEAFERSANDSAEVTDATTRTATYGRTPADTAGVSDAVAREVGFGRSAADTVGAADGAPRTATFERGAADSVTTADTILAERPVGASDSVAVSDQVTRATVSVRPVEDTAAAAESAARGVEFGRAANDSVAASDQVAREATFGRAGSDSVAVDDAVARSGSFGRSPSDTATATDAAIRATDTSRPIADTIAEADALTRAQVAVRPLLDTVAVGDGVVAANEGATLARTISDTIAASDALALVTSSHRPVADSAALADAASTAETFGRGAADTVAPADALLRSLDALRLGADAVAMGDGVSAGIERDRDVDDDVAVTDQAGRAVASSRTIGDAIATADSVAVLAGTVTGEAADDIAVVDAAGIRMFSGRGGYGRTQRLDVNPSGSTAGPR